MMAIRLYEPRDWNRVEQLFKLNTPNYFSPEEIKDLRAYLVEYHPTYFVYEIDNLIVGSGGYHFEDVNSGRLSWYFVHPEYQGNKIGYQLVAHNLSELKKSSTLTSIEVHTSQLAYKFFARFGFETTYTEEDHWAPGLHLYKMKKTT